MVVISVGIHIPDGPLHPRSFDRLRMTWGFATVSCKAERDTRVARTDPLSQRSHQGRRYLAFEWVGRIHKGPFRARYLSSALPSQHWAPGGSGFV